MEDAEKAKQFMDAKNIAAYNTRLFKKVADDGAITYEVRLASAAVDASKWLGSRILLLIN